MRLRKSYWLLPILVLSCVLFLTASIPEVSTGTWQTWNNMGDVRSGAAAVLLQDGRVFIIGGTNANGPVASADLFGTDGVFSAAAAMLTPRSGHTATVLSDGRVLVTGGTTSGGAAVNTAEIYDPTANSWSVPVTTVDARADHTASLLSDGRVLLAGGHDSAGNALSTLEIFDPASANFSSAGAMSVPRMNHAAATLGDSRILIIGGTADGTTALASIDIYDPSSGTVSMGPVLSTPRMSATATTTLDGKVAVIGGNNGSANGSQDLVSAEIFDPATGQLSTSASNLVAARSGHQAFLLPKNNAILVLGGSSSGTDLNSAELYYPWADSFRSTGALSVARPGLTGSAIGLDGRLLAAGGAGLASTELYGFATVKTDAADYPPGSTVTITGSGWQPGETVTLTLLESPLIDTHPAMTALADAFGNIVNNQFSPDVHDVNVRFYLTAIGSNSGFQAQTTFTDGISVGKIPTVGAQTPNPVPPGNSATYSVTVTFTGSGADCTATLAIGSPALPAGASASFSTNPISNSTSMPVTLTVSTTAGTTPVGSSSFQITASGSGSTPCNGSASTNPTGTGGNAANPTLAVSKANQTISFGTLADKTHGDTDFNVSATATSGLAVTFTASGNCTVAGTLVHLTGVGSCIITAHQAGNSNYNAAADAPQSFNIVKATPTITWSNPADIVYGTGLSGTQLNATASVPGSFVYTPASGTVFAAGNAQNLHVDFTPTDTANYNTASKDVKINVNKASLTVTANDKSRGYGDANPTFDATITGFGNSETESGLRGTGALSGSPICASTATATSPASPPTVAITCIVGSLTATNYTFSFAPGALTITKAHLTVTADNKSRGYGDANPSFTFSLSGFKNDENATSASVTGSPTLNTTAVATSSVAGSPYAITVADTGGLSAANYDFPAASFVNGQLTITKAHLTVTADNKSKTYDGAVFSPFTATLTGFKNGETESDLRAASALSGAAGFTGTATTAVNANPTPYVITPTLDTLSATNYDFTVFNDGQLTINKADAHITVTPYSVTYNGAAHTATGTATGVESPTPADLSSLLHVGGSTHTDAGDYPSDGWTFDGNGNYNATSGTVHDSIAKAPVTATAGSYGGTYDGLAHSPSACAVTGTYTGDLSCVNDPATVGPDAGSGSVAPAVSGTGLTNFDITPVNGSYTISKADPVVTAVGGTFTYDGNPHAGSGTAKGVLNEDLTPVNVAYKDSLNNPMFSAPVNAGSYSVAARFAGNNNYNPKQSAAVTLMINKAPVTATAGSYNGTYDGAAHSPSACAVTGTYTGDLSCVNDPATVGPNVSSGSVAPAVSGTGLTNFAVTLLNGSFTISKANATIAVTPYSVAYNGAAHTATGAAKGVLNENLSGLNLSGTTHTNPGDYLTDSWNFTDVTGNYNNANGTVHDSIGYGACSIGAGGVILPPINSDGTSVYSRKGGSTIPVKFNVCGANGAPLTDPALVFAGTGGALTMTGAIRGTITVVNEIDTNDIPDAAFTWDGQQWHFNMATMNLNSATTYTFRINLAYGPASILFRVGLK